MEGEAPGKIAKIAGKAMHAAIKRIEPLLNAQARMILSHSGSPPSRKEMRWTDRHRLAKLNAKTKWAISNACAATMAKQCAVIDRE